MLKEEDSTFGGCAVVKDGREAIRRRAGGRTWDEISWEGCRRSVLLLVERGGLTVLHSGSSISITLRVKCVCIYLCVLLASVCL